MTTNVASADGTQIALTTEGAGPSILIVHPGGGTSSSWTQVSRRLAAHFQVTRFDRRPYRTNGGAARDATMQHEVADILAITASLPAPVLLGGHSSGATVALGAALASPSSIAGLALYEPPVAVTEPLGGDALARAQDAIDQGKPGLAMRIHLREIVKVPALITYLLPLFLPIWKRMKKYAPGQIADDENLESLGVGIDRYADLHMPVCLIGGARSPKHLRDRLDALATVLPELDSVVILEKQGHLANLRAPTRLARAIETFADRTFA